MVATRHSYHKAQVTVQHSTIRKNVIKRIHVMVATRHINHSTTQQRKICRHQQTKRHCNHIPQVTLKQSNIRKNLMKYTS